MKKKRIIIISLIILIGFIFYITFPVLDCKKSDTIVTGDAIYESEDIERVSELENFNIGTIGSSMNPVITENSECSCIKQETYEINDVIFFFQEIDGETMGITHRIIAMNNETKIFVTKGDNNIYPDYPIKLEDIVCEIPRVMRWQTW